MTTYHHKEQQPAPAPDNPPVSTAPASTASGTALIVLANVFGLVLMLGGLILPHIAVSDGHSVADAHSVCHSGLGQFAQALDHGAQRSCSRVDMLYSGLWTSTVVGFLLLGAGVFGLVRRTRRERRR